MADNAQPIPQHPDVPQDDLDLNLSGSSMRFLSGDDPDLSLDQLFDAIVDEDSSSSSDASSAPIEERARFAAAQSRCANILIFGRKGLPNDVFIRGSSSAGPVVIDRSIIQSAAPQPVLAPTTGLEIVPWKLVKDAIALQLWPAIVQSRREAKAEPSITPSGPVILLEAPPRFEFHSEQERPSPSPARGRKNRAATGKKTLALPSAVSASNTSTPLAQNQPATQL